MKCGKEFFVTYVEYDKGGHKCRQYGLHKTMIRKVKEAPKAVKWYENYGKQLQQKIRSASPLNTKRDTLKVVAQQYLIEHSHQPTEQAASSSIPLFYEQFSPLGSPENFDWVKLLGKTAA